MSKVAIGILFSLLFMILGFFAGLLIGSTTVSTQDGLAAGAIVVGYGFIGAIVALVIAIFLSVKLEMKALSIMSLASLVLILGMVGFFVLKKQKLDQERAIAEAEEARNKFRSFTLVMTLTDPVVRPPALADVEQVSISQRGRSLSLTRTDSGRRCSAWLDGQEPRMIVGSIYGLATQKAEHVCRTTNDGPQAALFDWHFYDTGSPKSGEWGVTAACFASSTAATQLAQQISDIVAAKCESSQ